MKALSANQIVTIPYEPSDEQSQEFADLRKVAISEGKSEVEAVYAAVGAMSEKYYATVPIACCKGCNVCCYQITTVTPPEWKVIETYIKKTFVGEELVGLKQHLGQAIRRYVDYHSENARRIQANPLTVLNDSVGIPCPFLNAEGGCDIYPVRPIDCWTFTSTVRCAKVVGQEGSAQLRFQYEVDAMSALTEIAEATGELLSVAPMLNFLIKFTLFRKNRKKEKKRRNSP